MFCNSVSPSSIRNRPSSRYTRPLLAYIGFRFNAATKFLSVISGPSFLLHSMPGVGVLTAGPLHQQHAGMADTTRNFTALLLLCSHKAQCINSLLSLEVGTISLQKLAHLLRGWVLAWAALQGLAQRDRAFVAHILYAHRGINHKPHIVES